MSVINGLIISATLLGPADVTTNSETPVDIFFRPLQVLDDFCYYIIVFNHYLISLTPFLPKGGGVNLSDILCGYFDENKIESTPLPGDGVAINDDAGKGSGCQMKIFSCLYCLATYFVC